MLNVRYHTQFKKDYKLLKKNHYNMELLNDVIKKLADGKKLDLKYKDHPLKVNI